MTDQFRPQADHTHQSWDRLSCFRPAAPSLRACHQAALCNALLSDSARSVLLRSEFENVSKRRILLITIKASRQAGLTGLKGGMIRKVVVNKTRSSLEGALNGIRQNLEGSTELSAATASR